MNRGNDTGDVIDELVMPLTATASAVGSSEVLGCVFSKTNLNLPQKTSILLIAILALNERM